MHISKLIALSVTIGALTPLGQPAIAKTYTIDETQSHYINCYHKVYVPARVLVNTRGVLVRASNTDWEIVGDEWNHVRNPPVYIETKQIVEGDHYTLESSACPAN